MFIIRVTLGLSLAISVPLLLYQIIKDNGICPWVYIMGVLCRKLDDVSACPEKDNI